MKKKLLATVTLLAILFALVSCTDENGNACTSPHVYGDDYVCDVCGDETDGYVVDGDYVYFGEYPQTLKADDVTVTDTTDSRGYYLGSDGEYYAMVTASPFMPNYTFSTGETITGDKVYYFKVEPIRWRILAKENGSALLLCDGIIDNIAYQPECYYDEEAYEYCTTANNAPSGTYANNYEYSGVRAWLNSTFFDAAFGDFRRELILTKTVENGAESAGGFSFYICSDTADKVFLLSYAEITNASYGFAPAESTEDEMRQRKVNDYTLAKNAWMTTVDDYYGNGWWWLRSPRYDGSLQARIVDDNSEVERSGGIVDKQGGIVPAIWIQLES